MLGPRAVSILLAASAVGVQAQTPGKRYLISPIISRIIDQLDSANARNNSVVDHLQQHHKIHSIRRGLLSG